MKKKILNKKKLKIIKMLLFFANCVPGEEVTKEKSFFSKIFTFSSHTEYVKKESIVVA